MLRLTKSADYGLIAMRHLALKSGSASARDLARAHGIPPQLLAKVLQRLVKAGLLLSQHGIRGGYILARDPRSISALEVIQAIEGPPALTSCTTVRGPCGQTRSCTVREPLRRLGRSLETALDRISLLDLSEPDAGEEEALGRDLVAIKSMD